jgi:hypothetical protein
MNIALVDNGQVTAVGDYRALFPQTSFPPSGPSDEFLAANNAMKVNVWLPYDQMTEKLSACPPYIDGDWVYTVEVVPLTPEDIDARNAAQAANVRADRNRRLAGCDWTQLSDAPVDPLPWQTYRQALRDVTSQPGFPWTVTWPESPDEQTEAP